MTPSKDEVISILKVNNDRIKKEHRVKKIYLFGSVSRGEVANDVDIMIEDDPKDMLSTFDICRLMIDFEKLFNSKVDIVCKDDLSEKFYKTIEDDLIAI